MWILRSLPALLTILGFLSLLQAGASAQGFGGDDNLYIPPKLTVESDMRAGAPKIEIGEIRRADWMALIPAVFFDNPGDWTIPERYHTFGSAAQTRDYGDTNGIENEISAIEKYREILNIIGYRLLQHPEATLSLRGCYSFEGGESGGVARERALVVREYLTNIWGIDTARMPLLEPARRADTFSSNPVQEEGRRVEFTADDPVLLDPVSFYRIGFSSYPTLLQALIIPNMEPDQVDSIEIMMVDEEGEVQDAKSFPGSPDSTRYLLTILWEQERSRGEEGLTMMVRVRGRDGRYRPSNSVFLPVHVSRMKGEESKRRFANFTIPFRAFQSPEFGQAEQRSVRNAVDWFQSRIAESDREGYLAFAQGNVDLVEHPGLLPVEVNVQTASIRAARQEYEEAGGGGWAGKLMVMMPVRSENEGERTSYVAGGQEAYDESMRRVRERQEEESRRRAERPALTLADSLADRRAEGMMTWIVDSLDLPVINSELPDNAGGIRAHFLGSLQSEEEQEESLVRTTSAMRKGLLSTGNEGKGAELTPEERWYDRGVRLEFWTRDHLETMMQMVAPRR